MATSSETARSPDYVDFDEYIDIQLKKAGSTIKATDVLTALVGVLTFVTIYLLTFVICDHWVVPGGIGPLARGIMLAIVVSVACAWLGIKVVWPWRRRVTGLFAANTIEKASPGLKSSLLNLIDLSESGREVRPEVYESIERHAALALTHVDVNEAVDRRSLLHQSLGLLATVVIFCLYWVFSPKNPATSLWRAMVPTADSHVATRTEITSVRPGDADVIARSQLDVTVDLRGEIPSQAWLYFSTADHKFVDEKIEMRLVDESTKEFRCTINGENGAGILQDMTYRISAGDDTTPEFRIRVIQPPAATIESIRLEFPEYTKREPVVQSTGAIDALEGTRVTLRATANMPLRSPALLQFFDDQTASKRAEEIAIHVTDGTKLEVQWKLEIRSDATFPHYYRIFCTNANGESDANPSLYSLAIRPDLPPEVVLRDPKTDLELPANAVLPLVIEARDPDFTLRYIDLKVEKNGSPILGPEIYEGHSRQFKKTFDWALKDYHFRPKDTITYWVQAQDNKQPIANTANTPKLKIRIANPIAEEQVKKNLDAAKKRQQQEDVQNLNAERPADDQRDEDESNVQKAKEKAARPKDQSQAGRSQPSQPDQKAGRNEDADSQTGQGDKGRGDKDEAPGRQEAKEKSSDANAHNNRKPNLDPNDPADDSKVLQRLLDQKKQAHDKENGSQNAGQGDRPPKDQAQDEKNADRSQPDSKKKPGSNADSANQAKSRDSATPQPAKKEQGAQSSASKPDGRPNPSRDQSAAREQKKKEVDALRPDKRENAAAKDKKEGPRDMSPQAGAERKPKADKSKPSKDDSSNQNPGGHSKEAAPKDPAADAKHDEPVKDDGKSPSSEAAQRKDPSGKQEKRPESAHPNEQKAESSRPDGSAGAEKKPDKRDDAASNDDRSRPDGSHADGSKDDQSKSDSSKGGNQSGPPQEPNQRKAKEGKSTDTKNTDNKHESGHQDANVGQNAERKEADDADPKSDRTKGHSDTRDDKPSAPADRKDDAAEGDLKKKDVAKKDTVKKDTAKKDATGKDASGKDAPDKAEAPDESKTGKTQDNPRSDGKKEDLHDVSPNTPAGQKTRNDRPPKKDTEDRLPTGDQNVHDQHSKPRDPSSESAEPETNRSIETKKNADRRDAAAQDASEQKTPSQADQKAAAQQSAEQKGGSQAQPSKSGDSQNKQTQSADGQHESQPGGTPSQAGKGKPAGDSKAGKPESSNSPGKSDASEKGAPSQTGGTKGESEGGSQKSNQGGGRHSGSVGDGAGESLKDTTGDANLDYAKKATDLVLQTLDNQLKRGKVDQKVLDELGWTEDQVRRFVERMRVQAHAKDSNSPGDEARRLQYMETLRSLELQSSGGRRSGNRVPKRQASEIESTRSIPPPEYRELYEAFTKSISKGPTSPTDVKK